MSERPISELHFGDVFKGRNYEESRYMIVSPLSMDGNTTILCLAAHPKNRYWTPGVVRCSKTRNLELVVSVVSDDE